MIFVIVENVRLTLELNDDVFNRLKSVVPKRTKNKPKSGRGRKKNTAKAKIPSMNGKSVANLVKFQIWKINTEIPKRLEGFPCLWQVSALVESLAWEENSTMAADLTYGFRTQSRYVCLSEDGYDTAFFIVFRFKQNDIILTILPL